SSYNDVSADTAALHSFPTRRASDLQSAMRLQTASRSSGEGHFGRMKASLPYPVQLCASKQADKRIHYRKLHFKKFRNANSISNIDRKSTRLNSSHVSISYAVFCLKK